jgi:hypothetical protein
LDFKKKPLKWRRLVPEKKNHQAPPYPSQQFHEKNSTQDIKMINKIFLLGDKKYLNLFYENLQNKNGNLFGFE